MTLLAERLVEVKVVESINPATVWRTLRKRDQALAQAAVGHPGQAERAVRGRTFRQRTITFCVRALSRRSRSRESAVLPLSSLPRFRLIIEWVVSACQRCV